MKIATAACLLSVATGCGDGPSSTQAVEPHDEKSFGKVGGQHALGANPDAELARLKKAATKAGNPAAGHLPGR
ncbi:MAG: hypothetical protein BGO49_12620 [Planctomycetales bacterium 71-10]|nr:MAG: hypothetical protein BGO49_12620 [Planctomycetales bacterium 71-10]